jgi:hypothetical protein
MGKTGPFQKLYLVLVLAVWVAMLLPESQIQFDGRIYYTYMFTSYSVWVAFALAFGLMAFAGWCILKNRPWPLWTGIIGAVLIASASLYRIIGFLQANNQESAGSLAEKSNLHELPGVALWLWAVAGVLQIAMIYKMAGSRK